MGLRPGLQRRIVRGDGNRNDAAMARLSPKIDVYEGTEPYVFVCYSHDDLELVQDELRRLQRSGLRLWYDEGIPAGSEWSDVLAARIQGCETFLYFVTARSVVSSYCRQEVSFALGHDNAVLAVHLEPVDMPAGLRLSLSNRQSLVKYKLDVSEYERRLVRALLAPSSRQVPASPTRTRNAAPTLHRIAIAVMPFKNLSSEPEQQFLSDGISEDILNRLTMHPELIVKARTSSFALGARDADIQTIAATLGVTHVLEGSVQKSREKVRINARLISTAEETQIWSSQFTRELDDVFVLQDEVGAEVLKALNLHLADGKATRRGRPNRTAYHAYLHGRYHANRMDIDAAFEAFTRAVEADPDYADAHAALADMHFTFRVTPVADKLSAIRDSLARALALEPDHALANELQASVHFMFDLRFQSAIDTLARMWHTYPDRATDSYAAILRSIGRFDDALILTERILERDPLSPIAHRNRAMYLRDLGRYDDARAAIDQAENLGLKLTHERATLAFESADERDLECWIATMVETLGETHILCVAHTAALGYLRDDSAFARQSLERLSEVHDALVPAFLKWVLALFSRDLDLALQYFARALDNREHLAFTWSQGSAGMRRLFPWFYESEQRQAMLQPYGLDEASIGRLRVTPL